MAAPTIEQALQTALAHHQAGRLAEAEAIYRQILAVQPQHADALHLLGVIAQHVGRNDVAVDLISQAIALRPGYPEAHCNLGNALRENGKLNEAVAAFRQAVTLRPDFPEAHSNMGSAMSLNGQREEAIASFRKAIALRPGYPEAHCNLGNALLEKGELDEAIAELRQATALMPDFPQARYALGIACHAKGQLDESIAAYRQAIALMPNYPEAYSNLGNVLRDKGLLDDAIVACQRAIDLKPDLVEAHCNLSNAFADNGRLDDAIAVCRKVITLRPSLPEGHYNLGNALKEKVRLNDAISAYRQAIILKPNYPEACTNLGSAFQAAGQLDDAIASYRRAIALDPQLTKARSNLVFALNYHPEFDATKIAEEHRRWGEVHAEPLRKTIQPHTNDRSSGRRLRIGYVSPDFREHSVAFFLENVLACHDSAEFEIFCYASVARPDAVTARLRSLVPHWRNIIRLPDEEVAALIRKDAIDILVDLSGHTAHDWLLVFARKPAPVQVTWLGYTNTTGLRAMDYRISDARLDPPGISDQLHTEQIVRLPETFACYQPPAEAPETGPLPALSRGYVTFASFHTLAKLNDRLLASWAMILAAVPSSRLMLMAEGFRDPSCRERLAAFFVCKGVARDRIEFRETEPLRQYLLRQQEVDVLLDSHPCSGHTIACHALWMGVPVVTLPGGTSCSRLVASVLGALGIPELVAQSPEAYVQISSTLASDLPRLSELRGTLRARMLGSPLMDAPRFARNVEAAYRTMWAEWCASQKGAV